MKRNDKDSFVYTFDSVDITDVDTSRVDQVGIHNLNDNGDFYHVAWIDAKLK